MFLLSCYILLFLCEMVEFRGEERVLKGESGEERDSFSVSWGEVSFVLVHSSCVGNRQKE